MDEKSLARFQLTQQLESKDKLLIETDLAAVMKDRYPKAQYHFLIVAKEDIKNVTELTREHLPLLDHMKELANQIIDQQQHLPSSSFLIGFKIDAFMNRLSMHVISNDFYSVSLKKISHWNSFNSELFLTYQLAYALLSAQGSIDPLPFERAEELRKVVPLHCNQCDFSGDSLLALKGHLSNHWKTREKEFEIKKQVDKISKMLDESKLEPAQGKAKASVEKPKVSEQCKPQPQNWRQNQDQWQSNVKDSRPNDLRQGRNHRPPFNPFQNQQHPQNVYPMQGRGLMGPRPLFGQGPHMPQSNYAHHPSNGSNQRPPFMFAPQNRAWENPNNSIHEKPFGQFNQVQQPTDSPSHFNPFRQTPNMGPDCIIRQNSPVRRGPNSNPKWKPNPLQNAMAINAGENSSTAPETLPNNAMLNKTKWKPKPHQNSQNTVGDDTGKNNSNALEAQPNKKMQNKPKWQPNPQQRQNAMAINAGGNSSTAPEAQPNNAMLNKPKWKPMPHQNTQNTAGGDNDGHGFNALEAQPNKSMQNKPKWKPKQGQNSNNQAKEAGRNVPNSNTKSTTTPNN